MTRPRHGQGAHRAILRPVQEPLYLSPYLRPVLQDGVAVYDNAITESIDRLDDTEEKIVQALWDPMAASVRMSELQASQGIEAVDRAIASLRDKAVLFRDADECNLALDASMNAGLPDVPFVDQVELTSFCPMRCKFCPRGVEGRMTRPRGHMDLGLFYRLLDQLHPGQAHYRPMELHHLGESLLHPQVDRFVAAASERGLPTELALNPSLLIPELGHKLVAAGIRRIVASLDGMDDEVLTGLRGPAASYAKAEKNLDALIAELARTARPPTVVIQMIALSRNIHQREAFIRRWGTLGVPWVKAFIKTLEGPDPDTLEQRPAPAYVCNYPWRSVVVLWDGRVVPCCRDDDAKVVLGDLKSESLRDIWHGESASRLRELHRSGTFDSPHLCKGCEWRRQSFAATQGQRHPARARPNPLEW